MIAAVHAHPPLASLALLSEAECEDWVLRVLLLRRHWRRRHPQVPFFTLGLAAYIDCLPGQDDGYRDATQRDANNQLLGTHFMPLLQRLAQALSAHFDAPVRLAPHAAWPGFHIYLPHPAFALPLASVHRDLQHLDVFPACKPEADDLFSFTFPLSTPLGSGLTLWTSADAPARFLAYRSGELVVHRGLDQHQAMLRCDGELERITLQGHGIRLGRHDIVLYW
ncbi:hypothetical protein NRY95_10950 [Xanthomonas campestris pv. phormiicola]|nr:hypothetical protein [Xanthomonas campestris pv. phormiicola]UYC18425.1 hypothetical protein NRY95_10950 [Xanthomonas campestris pv. phormiicola]